MHRLLSLAIIGSLACTAPAMAVNCLDVPPEQLFRLANRSVPMNQKGAEATKILDARAIPDTPYCSVLLATTYEKGRLFYFIQEEDGHAMIHARFEFIYIPPNCRGNLEKGTLPVYNDKDYRCY